MINKIVEAAAALYRFFISDQNTRIAKSLIGLLLVGVMILVFVDALERASWTQVTTPWTHHLG